MALSIIFLFAQPALTQGARSALTANSQTHAVTVVSEPKAIIWIDGVRYGTTDATGKLSARAVPVRPHVIRARAEGFKEISKTFPAGPNTEFSVPLTVKADEADLAFQQAEKLSGIDREKAKAAYDQALKLRPKYPEAMVGLARIYSETGELEKAEKIVKQARQIRPGYAEASAVEGRIFKDFGEEEKAIAAFKRSIAEGKGFQPEAYTGLGLLYNERAETAGSDGNFAAESEHYTEAAKYFDVAVKQLGSSPDAVVVSQLLGLIYERQKKYKEAIAVYEEFLRIFPDAGEATAVRSFIEQIRKQMATGQ